MSGPRPVQARTAAGFSLLEMAVVLVIIGLLGALLWQILPRLRHASQPEPAAVLQLRQATDAVVGFALAHSRLPCPDTDADGFEDCAGAATIGRLPQRTLGQLLVRPLRYGVDRSAATDLTKLTNSYIPNIPGALPTPAPENGLDLCIRLRDAQASAFAGIAVGPHNVPTAFALADSGVGDASGNGELFDGLNAGSTFAAPGTPISALYDDYTAALGFGELAQRLGCPRRLAAVNGAARAAVAARDLALMVDFYADFRDFAYHGTRTLGVEMAALAVTLAAADMVIAGAQVALAAAGTGTSLGAAAFTIGLASLAFADAAANLVLAGLDLDEAIDAQSEAQAQYQAAIITRQEYEDRAEAARVRARAQDAAGLIQ